MILFSLFSLSCLSVCACVCLCMSGAVVECTRFLVGSRFKVKVNQKIKRKKGEREKKNQKKKDTHNTIDVRREKWREEKKRSGEKKIGGERRGRQKREIRSENSVFVCAQCRNVASKLDIYQPHLHGFCYSERHLCFSTIRKYIPIPGPHRLSIIVLLFGIHSIDSTNARTIFKLISVWLNWPAIAMHNAHMWSLSRCHSNAQSRAHNKSNKNDTKIKLPFAEARPSDIVHCNTLFVPTSDYWFWMCHCCWLQQFNYTQFCSPWRREECVRVWLWVCRK